MVWRIRMLILRLIDYLVHIPARLFRFLKWLFRIIPLHGKHKFVRWFAGSIMLAVDITPVPFLVESVFDFIKLKTRPLNEKEKEMAGSVFGKSIPFHLIGMDPKSIPAKKRSIAYVTFHTINFNISIADTTFIHELAHIWQYRKYGSVYISEAIWAQRWGGGYDYGGLEPLKNNCDAFGLSAFNFEQQANIIEEFYRSENNLALQWVKPDPELSKLLSKYCAEVRGT